MGTIIHENLIITGDDNDRIIDIIMKARELDLDYSGPVFLKRNATWQIFIATEGSKLGWGVFESGCAARLELMEFIDELPGYIEYVRVQHGETKPRILENDEDSTDIPMEY